MSRGLWYGVAAQMVWGLSPLYWRQLAEIRPPVLIAHRIVWAVVTLIVLLLATRSLPSRAQVLQATTVQTYPLASILIAINWLTYVWAVTAGHIIEASLGYFVTPLVSVALGVLVLGERLRPAQWTAVGIATTGLALLTWFTGALPWIALVLASSFGVYGLLKKQGPLGALGGLSIETGLLCIPAATVIAWGGLGDASALQTGWVGLLLLGTTGVMTVLPLALFTASVRRIPLAYAGLTQYLAPSLQFLLGVLVYKEPFGAAQIGGYALVWTAVLVFASEGLLARRLNATTGDIKARLPHRPVARSPLASSELHSDPAGSRRR